MFVFVFALKNKKYCLENFPNIALISGLGAFRTVDCFTHQTQSTSGANHLNLRIFYSREYSFDQEVFEGINCCVEHMVPDGHIQNEVWSQLDQYLILGWEEPWTEEMIFIQEIYETLQSFINTNHLIGTDSELQLSLWHHLLMLYQVNSVWELLLQTSQK